VLAHSLVDDAAPFDVMAVAHRVDSTVHASTSSSVTEPLRPIYENAQCNAILTRRRVDARIDEFVDDEIEGDPLAEVPPSSAYCSARVTVDHQVLVVVEHGRGGAYSHAHVRAQGARRLPSALHGERAGEWTLAIRRRTRAQNDSVNRTHDTQELITSRLGEFPCAMCRRRCNALVPIQPKAAIGVSVGRTSLSPPPPTSPVSLPAGASDVPALISIDAAVVCVERTMTHVLIERAETVCVRARAARIL